MVYILQFGVGQIQDQLIQSILICSHDEPNLGRCRIEYSFGIVDNVGHTKEQKKRERTGKKRVSD